MLPGCERNEILLHGLPQKIVFRPLHFIYTPQRRIISNMISTIINTPAET
jgi:hypothetical protein